MVLSYDALLYACICVSKFRPIADVPPFYVRVNFILMSHVGSRVSELADRQSQTTLNIILQADLTERFCDNFTKKHHSFYLYTFLTDIGLFLTYFFRFKY